MTYYILGLMGFLPQGPRGPSYTTEDERGKKYCAMSEIMNI